VRKNYIIPYVSHIKKEKESNEELMRGVREP
jgi:hypothetical protein